MTYTTSAAILQEPDVLLLDEEVASVADACAFQRRIDKRLTFSELRQQICLDYELGFVNAQNTLQRLWYNNLISTPDQLCGIVCAGVKALAAERDAA